ATATRRSPPMRTWRPRGRTATTCSNPTPTKRAPGWSGSAESGDVDGGEGGEEESDAEEKKAGGHGVARAPRQASRRARAAARGQEGRRHYRRRRRDGAGRVPRPAGRKLADPRRAPAGQSRTHAVSARSL